MLKTAHDQKSKITPVGQVLPLALAWTGQSRVVAQQTRIEPLHRLRVVADAVSFQDCAPWDWRSLTLDQDQVRQVRRNSKPLYRVRIAHFLLSTKVSKICPKVFSTFEEISTLFKSVKAILRARSGANSAIMSENPDDVDLEDGDEDLEEESPNKRARTE